jgi:hypothetical protein
VNTHKARNNIIGGNNMSAPILYIGGTIVYFLNRQGGPNSNKEFSNNWDFADIFWVYLASPIQKVN